MSKATRNRIANAEKQMLKREKEAIEAKKRKIRRVTAIITGTLIAILILVTLIGTITYNARLNSGNYLRQEIAASSVNIDVNGAMMNYYFNDVYNTFVNYYGSYVSYYGLDTTKSLKQQEISEGQSWFAYFMSGAKSNVSSMLALNEAAAANGFSLSDSEIQAIKTRSGNIDEGFYGRGVKKGDINDSKLIEALAYKFQFSKQKEFKPAISEISSRYDTNPKSYQSVDFLFYSFQWSTDGMTKEDAENEANRLAAAKDPDAFKAMQLELLAAASSEADSDTLESKLASYNRTGYAYTADDKFSEWAFGGAKAGTAKVITDEENSVYSVYMLTKAPYRDDNETIDVRHILFSATSYGSKEKALKKAQEIFALYKNGASGEEAFAELALAYSEDAGSYYNGGLYENISKGTMVQSFNDWCFDPVRQSGDVEVIETDYGYHIMYFVNKGLKGWESRVSNEIISEKFTEFNKEITSKYTVEFDDRVLNKIPG